MLNLNSTNTLKTWKVSAILSKFSDQLTFTLENMVAFLMVHLSPQDLMLSGLQ